MRALCDHPWAAGSVVINIVVVLVMAFILSMVFTSLARGLCAYPISQSSPHRWGSTDTLALLTMLVAAVRDVHRDQSLVLCNRSLFMKNSVALKTRSMEMAGFAGVFSATALVALLIWRLAAQRVARTGTCKPGR